VSTYIEVDVVGGVDMQCHKVIITIGDTFIEITGPSRRGHQTFDSVDIAEPVFIGKCSPVREES
jgi:hypothetical protein